MVAAFFGPREVEALAAQSAELAARIRDAQEGSGSTGTGQPSAAGFIWPCDGVVVSGFGMRWGRMHEGIDIGCAYGTPNRAAASGTVIYSGWLGGYGNLVKLDHGRGIETRYGHLSGISVRLGERIKRGQLIGRMGSTGRSTGSHLHYEVRIDGRAVNPIPFMRSTDFILAIRDRSGAMAWLCKKLRSVGW